MINEIIEILDDENDDDETTHLSDSSQIIIINDLNSNSLDLGSTHNASELILISSPIAIRTEPHPIQNQAIATLTTVVTEKTAVTATTPLPLPATSSPSQPSSALFPHSNSSPVPEWTHNNPPLSTLLSLSTSSPSSPPVVVLPSSSVNALPSSPPQIPPSSPPLPPSSPLFVSTQAATPSSTSVVTHISAFPLSDDNHNAIIVNEKSHSTTPPHTPAAAASSRFMPLPSSSPIFPELSSARSHPYQNHAQQQQEQVSITAQPPPSSPLLPTQKHNPPKTRKQPTSRQLEKQLLREERVLEKRRKIEARDRQRALNNANRRKSLHKDEALREMYVSMDRSGFLQERLAEVLRTHSVNVETIRSSSVHDESMAISLRRSVTTRYDADSDLFIPISPVIQRVAELFFIIKAEQIAVLASEAGYDQHVFITKLNDYLQGSLETNSPQQPQHQPQQKVLCIIQGLAALLKKSVNTRNHEVESRVRELLGHQVSASTVSRRKKQAQTEAEIEAGVSQRPVSFNSHELASLLEASAIELQLKHNWKLVYTTDEDNTIEWVISLLKELSVSWYKIEKTDPYFGGVVSTTYGYGSSSTSTDVNNPSTNNKQDVERALEQIKFLSKSVSTTLVAEYKTLANLADVVDEHGSGSGSGTGGDGTGLKESLELQGREISLSLAKSIELILGCRDADQLV